MALQAPANYSINARDPLAGFMEGIQMRQQFDSRQLQQQEAENIKRDIGALGSRPSVAAITDLITKYPQLADRFKGKIDQLSAEEKQAKLSQAYPIYHALQVGNSDVAMKLLQQQVDAARNSGDEKTAREGEAQIETIKVLPGAVAGAYGLRLAGIMGPEAFKTTFESIGAQQKLPSELKKLQTEAERFARDEGIDVQSSEILQNGVSVVIGKDGRRLVRNAFGNVVPEGPEAERVIREARDFEVGVSVRKAGGSAEAVGRAQAATAPAIAGGAEAGKAGVQAGNAALQTATKISGQLANLRRARELAKGGADTGVIASRLPNWSASSIELANMRNQLGLDVIGQATFGALSEGELSLALNTALPTNLNEADLVTWLDRKITAQEKMRTEMMNAAKFLSKPGNTLDKWLEQNGGAPAPAGVAPGAPGAGRQPVVSVDY